MHEGNCCALKNKKKKDSRRMTMRKGNARVFSSWSMHVCIPFTCVCLQCMSCLVFVCVCINRHKKKVIVKLALMQQNAERHNAHLARVLYDTSDRAGLMSLLVGWVRVLIVCMYGWIQTIHTFKHTTHTYTGTQLRVTMRTMRMQTLPSTLFNVFLFFAKNKANVC